MSCQHGTRLSLDELLPHVHDNKGQRQHGSNSNGQSQLHVPLEPEVQVGGQALRGSHVDVEVDVREDVEELDEDVRPLDVGLGENCQHLEVVDADGNHAQGEVLLVHVPRTATHDNDDSHEADDGHPRVVRALLAHACDAEVTLRPALGAPFFDVAKNTLVVADTREAWQAAERQRAFLAPSAFRRAHFIVIELLSRVLDLHNPEALH